MRKYSGLVIILFLLSMQSSSGYAIGGHYTNINGFEVPFSKFSGKILVLEFFRTDCALSYELHPNLGDIYSNYGSNIGMLGLVSMAVTVDELQTYLEDNHTPWDVGFDSEDHAEVLEVDKVPSILVLDTNGIMVKSWIGVVDSSEVKNTIDELLEQDPVDTDPSTGNSSQSTPWFLLGPLAALASGAFYLLSKSGNKESESSRKKTIAELLELDE